LQHKIVAALLSTRLLQHKIVAALLPTRAEDDWMKTHWEKGPGKSD
jgi:hypothetical protein